MNLLIKGTIVFAVLCSLLPLIRQSNTVPSDQELKTSMNKWGFVNYPPSNAQFDQKLFKEQIFPMFNSLMNGTKQEWSTNEIIKLLTYGAMFKYTGESAERIINVTAKKYLKIKNGYHKKLETKEIFDQFEKDIKTYSSFGETIINKNNDLKAESNIDFVGKYLQFNTSAPSFKSRKPQLEYFLKKSKVFSGFIIKGFKITADDVNLIKKRLETSLISFYAIDNRGYINPEPILYSKSVPLEAATSCFFVTEVIADIKSVISLIPLESLTGLNVIHSNVNELLVEPSRITEKLSLGKFGIIVNGKSKIKDMSEFYNKSIKVIDSLPLVKQLSPSEINLFPSKNDLNEHDKIFSEPPKEGPNSRVLLLRLINSFNGPFNYDEELAKKNEYDILNAFIDNESDFSIVSRIIENNNSTLVKLTLTFYSKITNFEMLLNALKGKHFKTLILNSFYDDNGEMNEFFNTLVSSGFFKEVEDFTCSGFSFETSLKFLNASKENLKKLHFAFYGTFNGTAEIEELASLKDLTLNVTFRNDNSKFKEVLNAMVSKFPGVQKLSIVTQNELDATSMKIDNLKELRIMAKVFTGETEALKSLLGKPELSFVLLDRKGRSIGWKREGDSVAYRFKITKTE